MENPSLAPIIALRELREKLLAKLADNPDFQAYLAVEAALEKLAPTPNIYSYALKKAGAALEADKPTYGDQAYKVLAAAGHPMTLNVLISHMNAAGAEINGNEQTASLSSVLSRDDRFKSVVIRNRRAWALREWPEEQLSDPTGVGPAYRWGQFKKGGNDA